MDKNQINTLWKALAHKKQITAAHVIQHAILKAMMAKGPAKVEIAKSILLQAFKPITDNKKLANGAHPYQVIYNNIWAASAKHYGVLGAPTDNVLSAEEQVQYEEIRKQLTPKSMMRYYTYFFVRQDIFAEYQAVQGMHVAMELGAKIGWERTKDTYFTVCGVPDEAGLEAVTKELTELGHKFTVFREPDIGNQLTAIGVEPIVSHKRGDLKKYPLLKFAA